MTKGGLALCTVLAVASVAAHAQVTASYPSKPVRLILPYPPGGGTDIIARPLTQRLSETLKQQVIAKVVKDANVQVD